MRKPDTLKSAPQYLTPEEHSRFKSRWAKKGDCHVWEGKLDPDGYGKFFFRRGNHRAHRVAWFSVRGPIPAGMVVNHSCRNRACVNPSHLGLMTPSENALKDSSSPAYINRQKVHCKNGHLFDKAVTWGGNKQRVCSICALEKSKRLREKWKAEGRFSLTAPSARRSATQ